MVIAGMRMLAMACSFGLSWLIARQAVDDLGAYRTLLTFFFFLESLPLLGMQQYVMRQTALEPHKAGRLFLHSLLLGVGVAIVAAAGVAGLGETGWYSARVSRGLFIVAAGIPGAVVYLSSCHLLLGLDKGATYGILTALETVVRVALGAACLFWRGDVVWIIGAFVVTRYLFCAVYIRSLWPWLRDTPWMLDRGLLRDYIRHLPVFAGILALSLVARHSAMLWLAQMRGDEGAGFYGAANMLVDVGLLIPTAVSLCLMPRFARWGEKALGQLGTACTSGLEVMSLCVLPFTALVCLLAQPIVLLLFHKRLASGAPAYAGAVPVLQILVWQCVLMSIDQVLSVAMIAAKKQTLDLLSLAVNALAMLVALPLCISVEGPGGAARGLIIGSVAGLGTRILLARRAMPGFQPGAALWRPVCGCLALVALLALLPPGVHFVARAAAGLLTYAVVIVAVGALGRSRRQAMAELLHTETLEPAAISPADSSGNLVLG